MLDIKLLRAEPEFVKTRLQARLSDPSAVDDVLSLDAAFRAATAEAERLQAELNASSKQIGLLIREKKTTEAEAVKAKNRELGDQISVLNGDARHLEDERDENYS